MKFCSKCSTLLTHNNWSRSRQKKKDYVCKNCRKEYMRQYREKTIGYREKHSKSTRKSKLKKEYNITLKDYDQMFEEQNGVCAICKQPETHKIWGIVPRLSIDHNHKTGQIRKLLCSACNITLGFVKEDINTLLKMITYLNENNNAD